MYKKSILVLVVFFTGLTGFLLLNRQFSSTEISQKNSIQSAQMVGSIHDAILASEYQISQSETAVYQAPNRNNGFRAVFSDEGIELVPRVSGTERWSLGMALTQIGDDSGMIDVSDASISATGSQINYERENIVEWYINSSRGLEQGFTIQEHPTANAGDMLYLDLAVEGTLVGQAQSDSAIAFQNNAGQTLINYDHLFAFDANSKALPATMGLTTLSDGSQVVRLAVDTQAAQFPIVIDPLASAADWYAVTAQNDNLGFSVSTAGDVNNDGYDDVIVGANWYDNGSVANAGAAFVYLGGTDGLSPSVAWTGMGSAANEEYGFSVSEAGDINRDGYGDIIVGTLGADAAYVYYGDGLGINNDSVQMVTEQDGSEFGSAVSSAGDVNDDGFGDVIIGAPLHLDESGSQTGRAFVFYGSESGIGSSADWAATTVEETEQFGYSVSNAGDVNGDQVDDIIIGDIASVEGSGQVFVYHGAAGTGLPGGPLASEFDADWSANHPNFSFDAEFGYSVSNAGDVNADGIGDVIVGAPQESQGNGAAYVYLGPLDFNNQQNGTRIDLFGFSSGELFGYSVSTAGDVDGDGDSEVIVGSPNYDSTPARPSALNGIGGQGAGTATIFAGEPQPSEGLSFIAFIDSDVSDAKLGTSVDTAGDVNGDGYDDVITGAPTYDDGFMGTGRAFTFHGTGAIMGLTAVNDGPTELGQVTTLEAIHTSPNSGFNSYTWDFGDNSFGSGQITTHTYNAPGTYTATVTVSNGISGTSQSAVTFVTIQEELYVDPANGGSTTFDDGSGNTTQVNVPPGAVDQPIKIEFVPLDPSDFTSNRVANTTHGGSQPLPANNTNIFFDLNAGTPDRTFLPMILNNSSGPNPSASGTTVSLPLGDGGSCDPDHFCFDEPVVLVLGYNESDLNGQDETTLILVVWDENINEWVDATSTCEVPSGYTYDPANNTFSLEICHISRFGLVGVN